MRLNSVYSTIFHRGDVFDDVVCFFFGKVRLPSHWLDATRRRNNRQTGLLTYSLRERIDHPGRGIFSTGFPDIT
jgi:hypothetical protein